MANTREQLWNRIEVIVEELYHSGNDYVASVYWKQHTVAILKVLPKDENEDKILNLASIMTMFMSEDKQPLHLKGGEDGFTCSLIHRKDDEYIFMTTYL